MLVRIFVRQKSLSIEEQDFVVSDLQGGTATAFFDRFLFSSGFYLENKMSSNSYLHNVFFHSL